LLELTRQLTAARPLHEALQLVTEAALALLPAEHASIRVLDAAGDELLSGARSGSGSANNPVKHSAGQGVGGWVVEHGEAARIADVRDDPRYVCKPDQGFEVRSLIVVPLWSAGKVVGVLGATSPAVAAFDAEHEQLAALLANCASPAIETARLERLSITDAPTLAYNQGYLIPAIAEAMSARPDALSVLLVDLDHFKSVNDEHGHAAGDRTLRAVADILRANIRDNDRLVRRGGDEFVLVMPGTELESARVAAERIRTTIEARDIAVDHGTVRVTVSIGIAAWNGAETAEELERRADAAMYAAKRSGRNQVHDQHA
jgi:diguanylate cyclase (GGDEF)-like protein